MYAFWLMLAKKNAYGEAMEAPCQSSVGVFVDAAFGYHEFQSGSSAGLELMPIAWRFLVMIWIDATQSDQPEITWMFSVTGLPFGSISVLPLYVKPFAISNAFAAAGLYVASAFASALTFG